MAAKARRHQRIVDLLRDRPVPNQADLQAALAEDGISATQATLSRDLSEIGVIKGPAGYMLPDGDPGPGSLANGAGERLSAVLTRELVSATHGGTTVVLKTRPGHADALAIQLDRARADEVLGTIAGDDTIFVAARTARDAERYARRLRQLAGHR